MNEVMGSPGVDGGVAEESEEMAGCSHDRGNIRTGDDSEIAVIDFFCKRRQRATNKLFAFA